MAKPAVKTGRNDPCPCGSGRKYKHCCMAKDKDEELATARRAAEKKKDPRLSGPAVFPGFAGIDEDEDPLDAASNAVIDLIRAGQLNEAERAAHQLLKDHPYVHDGYDRLGMVEEARGNNRAAADWYRKVVAFMRENADNYDPQFLQDYLGRIARLDPGQPAS
ncbi:MAG: SEC-C metal-binding domain-containing protein [Alphaproteobacteria bacterium]|nr:SEC-C metal-binding domain-containing protein [Alphaproteobacteria bacterium]